MNNKKQPLEIFYKEDVLKNFSIFTGKYLYSSLLSIKLGALRSEKKEIPTQVFFCEY